MKKLFVAIIICCSLLFINGCGPSAVVVRERPAPPVYARPIAPGPGYVWIDGNWIANGRGYSWRPGYWAAPRFRHHYVPGHWMRKRQGWVWKQGHW
jgi:WXXGXW repeat (2 copies)